MRGEGASGAFHEQLGRALRELVRGFDEADQRAGGALLGPRSAEGLGAILAGLVTALLRVLVLALAAERGLLAGAGGISPAELRAELDDDRRRGATLAEHRCAWARLTAAFRAVHAARGGGLFDPARFPFLERGGPSDASVLTVLDELLVIRGELVRWAELEIEELGRAYEALIGLDLCAARGDSLVLLPAHKVVDLDALLAAPGAARALELTAQAGGVTPVRLAAALARADSTETLRAALARRASPRWPDPVPKGSLFLEPGEERRRSGAHYTPRALTQPLVARTLAPLLARAGALELRICDPAMGSGAFLVEVCRQLGDSLAAAGVEGAHQLVAERCLHGVDRDPIAVEVARVSLWLLAGARDRPFSFVDHALRAGDALLGEGSPGGPARAAAERLCRDLDREPLHWPQAFPEVFARVGHGFDAFVGNPPWVAYAGRAAQPLPADLFEFYRRYYPSFRGYRTLHALFVYRAASLLRPGGRLGLVVPTSILGFWAATSRRVARTTRSVKSTPSCPTSATRSRVCSSRRWACCRRGGSCRTSTPRARRGGSLATISIRGRASSSTASPRCRRCRPRASVSGGSRRAATTPGSSHGPTHRRRPSWCPSAKAPTSAHSARCRRAFTWIRTLW